ncbi:MAG: NosD domain-containing protein, partial [Candidatus Heimdallarchaeaceae archaeon]
MVSKNIITISILTIILTSSISSIKTTSRSKFGIETTYHNILDTLQLKNDETLWDFCFRDISSFSIFCFNSSKSFIKQNTCTNRFNSQYTDKSENLFLAKSTELSPHSPIDIQKDEDFFSLGLNNSGTFDDPFIIENLYINVTSEHDVGISIENTSSYFIIRNCLIESYNTSITINHISKNTAFIVNNTLIKKLDQSLYAGIYFSSSDGCVIEKNVCKGFIYGIKIEMSRNITIKENSCLGSTFGIFTNKTSNTS